MITKINLKQVLLKINLQLVGANETKSNNFKVIVAAKEVDIIDGYAENQKISKFDLVIDWGWFYWLVKPLFFAIDYFFKFSGNFLE